MANKHNDAHAQLTQTTNYLFLIVKNETYLREGSIFKIYHWKLNTLFLPLWNACVLGINYAFGGSIAKSKGVIELIYFIYSLCAIAIK